MSDREEWLEWRRGGIGGSDIGALLGLSRYQSPWSLWAEKCGLLPSREESERLWIGREFEPVLAKLVEKHTGLYVTGEQTWCSHTDEPWMRCTVDGFLADAAELKGADLDSVLGLAEFKTDARYGWTEVPHHIQAQCQWQMAVTGLPMVVLGVLFAGFKFETFTIERDEADIAFMAARARAFWFDHVVTGNPPPTDGSDATLDALAVVYPDEMPGSVVKLDGITDVVSAWTAAKAHAKHWNDAAKEAEAAIKATLGDGETGTVNGEPLISWRSQTRKSYTVEEATYRVLRFHKPKEKTHVRT